MGEKPADIKILRAQIVKPDSGVSINLLDEQSTVTIFKEINIEENIFTPGVNGTLTFTESSQIGEMLPLTGGEQLLLDVETPDIENASKNLLFYVHGVTPVVDEVNMMMRGNIRDQEWIVEFGSYENLYSNYTVNSIFEENSNNFVGKIASDSEEDDEEGLVQYLADKFFNPNETNNSIEEMEIEPTGNSVWLKRNHMMYPFRKQVQQLSPIQLMNYVTERAISKSNSNATNYLFWQDFDRWHFKSVNQIIKDASESDSIRNYYVDTDRNLNLLDSFASFIVAKEYSPLEFMDGGAYLSTYERIDPDYDNAFLDFTSFYDSHRSTIIEYSYQEEKDNIEKIEGFPLIDDAFEFEVSDSVKKYDSLYGYFDESHFNDPKIRMRHDHTEYSQTYRPDKNHIEPNKSYNESLLWQPMFDQTDAKADVLKSIIEIKEELESNRVKLSFKKDLKEKWKTYECSVCCLRGIDDGSTGDISTNYNIVSAGTFTDTVDYDPANPDANDNGFISSYPLDDENSPYSITMGELFNLKQPDEITSILYQTSATVWSLERMAQSIQEQMQYCELYPKHSNIYFDVTYVNNDPFNDPAEATYLVDAYTNLHSGAYEWAGGASPLGSEPGQSTPPYADSVFHGIYQPSVGGVHLFPCTGCYEPTPRSEFPPGSPRHTINPETIPPGQTPEGDVDPENPGEPAFDDAFYFEPGIGTVRDGQSARKVLVTDIERQDDCILSWGPAAIRMYEKKAELVTAYANNLITAWGKFVDRKVFVQSKAPYLDVPSGLETSFENVKSIKRKNIRGSRYEVFAMKESLVEDVESSYDYFVSYADFAGGTSGIHPYYDQAVNTEIGSFNGLLSPNIILGGIDLDQEFTATNALVLPEAVANSSTMDFSRNAVHVFTEGQPRYFALSGINNTTLTSVFGHLGFLKANRNASIRYDVPYDGSGFFASGYFGGEPGGKAETLEEYLQYGIKTKNLYAHDHRIATPSFSPDYESIYYGIWSEANNPDFRGQNTSVATYLTSDYFGGPENIPQVQTITNFALGLGYHNTPFDVFFTPFLGTKNGLSTNRHITTYGPELYPESSGVTNPFAYYTGIEKAWDQDDLPRPPIGTSNLGDNTIDVDEFAKNLGMSNYGLSTNYDLDYYRSFGFPGEIIVSITPTKVSNSTTQPTINDPETSEDVESPSGDQGSGPEPEAPFGADRLTSSTDYTPGGAIFGEDVTYWDLDGHVTVKIEGISYFGGRGGQLGYNDYTNNGKKSPLHVDTGYVEYNVGPQYTNAYDNFPDGSGQSILTDYVNRSNWYTPSQDTFKSPRRFFAEVQSYIRIEFEQPIGLETLEDFPHGFIRDAGMEYYAPYIVQLTAGPFGRHSANYNMSVIGVDPYGFDIAVTRTDKWKDYLFESGTKPVLYPVSAVEAEAYDPINVFYRTVTEENQWAHISFNNLPIPGERLPSSWHSFKAPMSVVSPDVLFENYFQSSIWHNGDYESYMNPESYQGVAKKTIVDNGSYKRYGWNGSGFIKNGLVENFGMIWDYSEETYPPPEEQEEGDEFKPEDYIWKFDVSGESEYGVITPPENATTIDDVKLDDYIHDLERNFSGQFVVFARRAQNNSCSQYECANPDGPVIAPPDTGEDDYDPYIECPMQELRPDILEYERYLEDLELIENADDEDLPQLDSRLRNLSLLGELTEDDFKNPTAEEIAELQSQVNECDLIEEKLGESYLGCIYSDPKAPNSCRCPEQGENFIEYLEASRTYATFWETPNEAPLRRDAQMVQLTTQKAIGVLPGDLSLRPGSIINVVNPHGITNKHPRKRSSGRWLIGSIKHQIRLGSHIMGLTCFRDSTPQDPNDITEPVYTQE